MAETVYTAEPTLSRFHKSKALVRGVRGPIGCTDADTEFLTPTGWKRIADWSSGDLVAQWHEGVMSFVAPSRYICEPCDSMILFRNARAVSMALTDEHRMPLYDWRGKFVVRTAKRVAEKPSCHVVPTMFEPASAGLGLGADEIRLRVMIAADAHYPSTGQQCVIAVRRERKKIRVREVLTANGIKWSERLRADCDQEVIFTFGRPKFAKPLNESANWYGASRAELQILLDEIDHWDGLHNHEERRFYTTKQAEADVVQFAAHACGLRASIGVKRPGNGHSSVYTVHIASSARSAKNVTTLRGDGIEISRITPSDGRKYCFTVPSSFWIARREGRIFVTGNSGKSVGCVQEGMRLSLLQKVQEDGWRRARGIVIRNTYPELKSTTIKTWLDWFGPITVMRWDSPITGTVKIKLPDGTKLHLEVLFLSMDRPQDVKKLKSLEATWIWLNEAIELPKAVLDMAIGRIWRYPAKRDGGAVDCRVFMDTNACDDDHWWYRLAEERDEDQTAPMLEALIAALIEAGYEEMAREYESGERQIFEFFAQPPAVVKDRGGGYTLNPYCENVANQTLGGAYWLLQIEGKRDEWIRVYLMGEYGSVSDGKPVYPEYRDAVHGAKDIITPMLGVPLELGWDFGRTPAVLIAQLTPRGQLRYIDEICASDMGIRQFARTIVKPHLLRHYRDFAIHSTGDPGGTSRTQITEEQTCIRELNDAGIPTRPAWTNELAARHEAIAGFMNRMVDGQPALQVSPKCKMLRKGWMGHYKYERLAVVGEERYRDYPVKNAYSHPCEAAEYAALGLDREQQRDEREARARLKRTRNGSTRRRGYGPADSVAGY